MDLQKILNGQVHSLGLLACTVVWISKLGVNVLNADVAALGVKWLNAELRPDWHAGA